MKYVLLAAVLFQSAFSKCPNSCNGHGSCNLHDQCTCFNEEASGLTYLASDSISGGTCNARTQSTCENAVTALLGGVSGNIADYVCKWDPTGNSGAGECKREVKDAIFTQTQYGEWTGADCSKRTCPRGTSWTTLGEHHVISGVQQNYICSHNPNVECSDQGLCDRATGLCECFPGYTGNACQRTECPDDCSGHGTCRSNKDFAYDWAVAKTNQLLQTHESTERFNENYVATYDNAWDSGHLYGCKCDTGYRGTNCAMIECPSSNDPLDDKCSVEEDELSVENFQVQKFAATGSQGWREAYVDSTAIEQTPDLCNTPANIGDATGALCAAVTGPNGEKCTFTPASTTPIAPARCEQIGVWEFHAPGDKNAHFYNGMVYACFGAMSGMDCSGRGLCDYSTGQCACFSGYSGTACSKIEELV